jgi:hypothetical protein
MKRQEVGENCIMRNFEVKKDEMGGACSTNGGKEECI